MAAVRVTTGMKTEAGASKSYGHGDTLYSRLQVSTLAPPTPAQDSQPDVPRVYATPKEMGAAGHDTMINKELGLEDVYDPLQSRNASPTPGPRTPPAYGEDTATIPPMHLPTLGGSGDSGIGGLTSGVASPVTRCDN